MSSKHLQLVERNKNGDKAKAFGLTQIQKLRSALSLVDNSINARKLLALAQGLVVAARKEYRASEKISELKQDRDRAYNVAVKAGELRLLCEAKLWELLSKEIKRGQPKKNGNNNVTLKNIGLTKQDSHRAQRIAEHSDLIPKVVAEAIERQDVPNRRDVERAIYEKLRSESLKSYSGNGNKLTESYRNTYSSDYQTGNQTSKIIQGNVLDVLKTLPSNSIDTVITSPCYWKLREYDVSPVVLGGTTECNHKWDRDSFCNECKAWKGQMGQEPTPELYIRNICNVFNEVRRVLKESGTCWVVMGDTYYGDKNGNGKQSKSLAQIPYDFSKEMTRRGWLLRNIIIWHKPNCQPSNAVDRFTIDYEPLFFFAKSERYYFEQQFEPYLEPLNRWGGNNIKATGNSMWDLGTGQSTYRDRNLRPNPLGRNRRSVWSIITEKTKYSHYATFPEALVEIPIKAGCPPSGMVLDPFCGSGTTGIVAQRLGRQFIGVELSKEYVNIARRRIGGAYENHNNT